MLLFCLVAVLPGALVYSVSVQFLNKSIESWFDVRVEKALEGGLSLGRTTLDNMLRELNSKADMMAIQLADARPGQLLAELEALRDQAGVREAAVFQSDGTIGVYNPDGGGVTYGAGLSFLFPAGDRIIYIEAGWLGVQRADDAPQQIMIRAGSTVP